MNRETDESAGTVRSARQVDQAAVRLARGDGARRLAIGELLRVLFKGERLIRLGYAAHKDYINEHMGVPARTVYQWVELAKAVEGRPRLRRAVVCGAITPNKAITIAPLAVGEVEQEWILLASRVSLAALQDRVRGEGGPVPDDSAFDVETLILDMTPGQQDRLDQALAMARETVGFDAPRWAHMEAIAQEWLGWHGEYVPGADDGVVLGEVMPRTASPPAWVDERAVGWPTATDRAYQKAGAGASKCGAPGCGGSGCGGSGGGGSDGGTRDGEASANGTPDSRAPAGGASDGTASAGSARNGAARAGGLRRLHGPARTDRRVEPPPPPPDPTGPAPVPPPELPDPAELERLTPSELDDRILARTIHEGVDSGRPRSPISASLVVADSRLSQLPPRSLISTIWTRPET